MCSTDTGSTFLVAIFHAIVLPFSLLIDVHSELSSPHISMAAGISDALCGLATKGTVSREKDPSVHLVSIAS